MQGAAPAAGMSLLQQQAAGGLRGLPVMQPHMGMMPNGAVQPLQNGTVQGFGLMYMQPTPMGAQPSSQVVPGMPKLNGLGFL